MKKALILFVFSIPLMFAGMTPVHAVTEYYCGCNPYDQPSIGIEESYECTCSNDNTLGELATKTYKTVCTYDHDNISDEICVTGLNKNTTCTIQSDAAPSGVRKMCTNWSVTSKDTVTITAYCQQYAHYTSHCN